jgi:hypothetical protein
LLNTPESLAASRAAHLGRERAEQSSGSWRVYVKLRSDFGYVVSETGFFDQAHFAHQFEKRGSRENGNSLNGGGYMFVHCFVLEYFASLETR